jgi:hypothetical protein
MALQAYIGPSLVLMTIWHHKIIVTSVCFAKKKKVKLDHHSNEG